MADGPRPIDTACVGRVGALPRTWVLVDDRPGNSNQALGVAEALGWHFEQRRLSYGPLIRLPNLVLGASLVALDAASRRGLAKPWPDLVISAGRRGVSAARWIRRANGGRTFLAQIMWPGRPADLDLIAVPEHDRAPDAANVLRILGAPHRVRPERLAAEALRLQPTIAHLPEPRIVCLVGGNSRACEFDDDDIRRLVHDAVHVTRASSGTLLVTTSRRTGESHTAILADELARVRDVQHMLHRHGSGSDNPYLGMLGLADAIIVTSDSTSMCVEACASGRPVYLFRPKAGVPAKLEQLHARLAGLGRLHHLGAPLRFERKTPFNEADTIADAIRARLTGQPATGAAG